jgi:ATP-dependent exoDNAse (exonuclease V) beta subunit
VKAVNHIFSGMTQPFRSGDKCIEFVKVQSAATAKPLQDAQGQALPPLTLWHLPLTPDVSDKPYWPADLHVNTMATGFATQMVKLLQAHADIHPGQMAVLVRSHAHAQAMQAALSRVGLPSVFLSDHANVYQSPQATDLWRVLRAISMPRNSRWLRCDMAGSIWGWNTNELVQAMHNRRGLANPCASSCRLHQGAPPIFWLVRLRQS